MKRIRRMFRKVFGRRMELCIINYSARASYTSSKFLRSLLIICEAPIVVMKCLNNVFPMVIMDVTSRCTLNCKECSHLIPSYKKTGIAKDYDTNSLLENIDLFMPYVNECLAFKLMGGEPFMNKQLYRIIDRLINEKKVKYIQILTNGTIIPEGENLAILKHKKVSVKISNYGALSSKKDALVELLKEHNIPVRLDKYEPTWIETNGLVPRGYMPQKMKRVFFNCESVACKALYDGKLWTCHLIPHGISLNLVKDNPNEYINLRKTTKRDFWKQLDCLYNNPAKMTTCYSCSGGSSDNAKKIPCAEQEQ